MAARRKSRQASEQPKSPDKRSKPAPGVPTRRRRKARSPCPDPYDLFSTTGPEFEAALSALREHATDPPREPEAAAFWTVVTQLVLLLSAEVRGDRREAIERHARETALTLVRVARGPHPNLLQQYRALLVAAAALALRSPRDLRKRRSGAPHPLRLLEEYGRVKAKLREIPRARSAAERKRRLTAAFPELNERRKALDLAVRQPSEIARVILASRYGKEPLTIKEWLDKARRQWKGIEMELAAGALDRSSVAAETKRVIGSLPLEERAWMTLLALLDPLDPAPR